MTVNAHFYCFEKVVIFLTERQVIIRTEEVVIFWFSHLVNDPLVAPSANLKIKKYVTSMLKRRHSSGKIYAL